MTWMKMAFAARRGAFIGALLAVGWPGAALAEPRMAPPAATMALAAPPLQSLAAGCNTLATGAATQSVAVKQTLYDDFHDFDPAKTRWALSYYRPWDKVAAHTHDYNGEQQVYVDPRYAGIGTKPLGIDPFSFEKGRLAIDANKLTPAQLPFLHRRLYSSGMLQSRSFFYQRYGYFEASIRIPAGKGLWPAFWMVPMDTTPPELDVLESVGNKPEEIFSTLHWNYKDPKNGHLECKRIIADATQRSVVYGVLWTPEMLVYYTDRVPVQAIRTNPTMVRPMYLILNLAVGGPWPGPVTAATPATARMVVDWVAAYSLAP